MRTGSLFTGCGGLDLGLPGHPAWMCEYDKHARRVLEQRFPGVPVGAHPRTRRPPPN